MYDDDKPKPETEVDAMLDSVKTPEVDKDPEEEADEGGAPDGANFV